MDKEALIVMIEDGLSLRGIAKASDHSLGSIKHWMRKFGLKTKHKQSKKGVRQQKSRPCVVCSKVTDSRRRLCAGCRTKIRRYRTKQAAVRLKGGNCKRCGWTGNIAAFHFHHRDSCDKEFIIGVVANKSWEIIKKELAKCDMLCANCHAVEHANNEGESFLTEVEKYNGNLLGR